jgi:energy-coupling factor transporter ATP-binding protein EcfA2
MGKILGISGRKQSGKNTFANYVNGVILKENGMIQDFYIDENGNLVVQTTDHDGKLGYGMLDVNRKDLTFLEYAETSLWPYVKVYSFADYLKEICIHLFDFKYEQAYGTDDQKNTKTNLMWENMPGIEITDSDILNTVGPMTAREFMQFFGTEVIRKIKDSAWTEYTLKKIIAEDSELAIIADVRFPNEVKAIKNFDGSVVRLTRDIFSSDHMCETALDEENFDWHKFDCIIDNNDKTIQEFCEEIQKNKNVWSSI